MGKEEGIGIWVESRSDVVKFMYMTLRTGVRGCIKRE